MNISIIVPAYNNEALIQSTVSEIIRNIKESAHEFEIIVIDDGSRDKTFRRTLDLRRHHPQVMIIRHSENLGIGMAIRTGIENARYELIGYVPVASRLVAGELAAVIIAAQTADIVLGFSPDRSAGSWHQRLKSSVITRLTRILFGTMPRGIDRNQVWNQRIFSKITLSSRGIFLPEEILIKAVRRGFSVTEINSIGAPDWHPALPGPVAGIAVGHPLPLLSVIREMLALWRELRNGKSSGS